MTKKMKKADPCDPDVLEYNKKLLKYYNELEGEIAELRAALEQKISPEQRVFLEIKMREMEYREKIYNKIFSKSMIW